MNKGLLFIFAGLFGASLGLAAEKTDGNAKGYGASGYGAEGYSEGGYGAKGYSASNGELGYNQGVGYGELGYGSIGYDPPKKDKKKGFFSNLLGPKSKSDSTAAPGTTSTDKNAQSSAGSAAAPVADKELKVWSLEFGGSYASSDLSEDSGLGAYGWFGIRRRFGSTIGVETGLDLATLYYVIKPDYSSSEYSCYTTGFRIPVLLNLNLSAFRVRVGVAYEIPIVSSMTVSYPDDGYYSDYYYSDYDYYGYGYGDEGDPEFDASGNMKLIVSGGFHLGQSFELGYTYTSDLSSSFTIDGEDVAMSSHGLYMAFNF